MQSAVRKYSCEINGRPNSVSLEAEFYAALRQIADARGLTVQSLISQVAAGKTQKNLCSELRLTVLRELQRRLGEK